MTTLEGIVKPKLCNLMRVATVPAAGIMNEAHNKMRSYSYATRSLFYELQN